MAEPTSFEEIEIMNIEELIQDPENTDMFYCPARITRNCLCLEEFIMKHSWMNENLGTPRDALNLLKRLRREALKLSYGKCTINDVNVTDDDGRLNCRVSGNRKSKKYIEYIVETRHKLRSHGICEIAAQKILKYSKNIIYRKLKHDDEGRNDLISEEMSNSNRNKNLIPIEDLMKVRCCKNKCTNKLKNDVTFYSKLRSDAKTSSIMKREAIKKLLMTTSGEVQRCNKFIVLLLGVSRNTIRSAKNFLGLRSKRVKNQESSQTDKKLVAYTQNLETTMPVQTSSIDHQTADSVNNFQQVFPTPQDMWQTSVSFQNMEAATSQTQQMFYPANRITEFNPNGYSFLKPEQFQTTMPMNPNISMQGYPNVANVCPTFYVPNEGVASAIHNPNIDYRGYTGQNAGNNILPAYHNMLLPQQYNSINPTNHNMVNDISYQYLPIYPANMNRMYTTNPSPRLDFDGMPVTTHTPSSLG
ncbi:hypothetical protein RF11_09382 [Thelohanellus kitauei]|uniref:Uncharacterized protein n=1 Tax=Thelohanellus kitauei TaxID=669202 RepID=A0A0C2M4S0_THEKT|nr:hypothetical protein RF11_09382 [Thelohanellus kitauei]